MAKDLLRLASEKLKLEPDKDGNLPIMTAIDSGNIQLCQELLLGQVEAQINTIKVCMIFIKIFLGSEFIRKFLD